jgi:hypothetical protein
MAAFQRIRTQLAEELGVRPMEETWKLLRDIATHEPVADLLPAPAWDEPPATIDLRATHVPLLGRTAEMTTVRAALAGARAGSAALVVVEGEAGTGKSRLMSEGVEELEGTRVGRARCSRLERDLPFVPLLRALRSALPPSAGKMLADRGADPGDLGKTTTLDGITDLVDAHGPLVLVLDDLHWADPATITSLAYLTKGEHPLVVLAGLRPGLVTQADPVYWLEPHARVSLGPLSAEDLAPLAVPGLHRRTRGHPLLVAEWLRAQAEGALDELPVRLGPWIREQAGGDVAHQLLVTAAFIDEPFDLESLTPVLGPLTRELVDVVEGLVRCGLLDMTADGLHFRHPMLRDVLTASVSPWRRRLLELSLTRRVPVATAV